MENFNENIRNARRLLGLSQEEMADRMGVQRSTYGKFERGETPLFNPCMYKFLEATGFTAEEILFQNSSHEHYLSEDNFSERLDEIAENQKKLFRLLEKLASKLDKDSNT